MLRVEKAYWSEIFDALLLKLGSWTLLEIYFSAISNIQPSCTVEKKVLRIIEEISKIVVMKRSTFWGFYLNMLPVEKWF